MAMCEPLSAVDRGKTVIDRFGQWSHSTDRRALIRRGTALGKRADFAAADKRSPIDLESYSHSITQSSTSLPSC
jgi:hypothetical protein